MSKHKSPPSKRARSSKTATKAERATPEIVQSQNDSHFRSAVANPTNPSPKRYNETEREFPLVENPAAVQPDETEQGPLLVENLATAPQPGETKQELSPAEISTTALAPNDIKEEALRVESPALAVEDGRQTMINQDSKKEFDFAEGATNVKAYQAKLLEVAHANMQLASEFTQRLAGIRLPFEISRCHCGIRKQADCHVPETCQRTC
jgi:hypothetical protein